MKKIIGLNDIARLDLNLATSFLAIWEERSVSRAAIRLNLSQSAVSGALARLRAITDDPLFVRTRMGMEPTPRAIAMAPVLSAALDRMSEALTPLSPFVPEGVARALVVGMSDDFMLACGPALVRRLLAEAPQASVIFRQCNSRTAAAMLESREIDMAMIAGGRAQGRGQAIRCQAIGQSSYLCLADPLADPFANAAPLTVESYIALPHVLVSYSGRSGLIDEALQALGRKRRVITALTQFAALPPFLQGSGWIATLPTHAALALARSTGLATFAPPLALEPYEVTLCWRRDGDADQVSQWLRGLMADVWQGI
ncbi:DNA-binding transcriptional LysR family regulator [Novosphingobium sp. SG751A]|uniref:LysR substrate-binding domain-containing protein n=1 Tax=Novosphingobium sp. SG751A TaxID=2587000 RepID=UPI001C12BCCE|nr:LysR substrate-binding domain-containing protein [Novosphingobium sp. SG751A]NOW47677.1 DNA-binding transcriptional LysR family regulator [Novosphingobium sp. SG751A]